MGLGLTPTGSLDVPPAEREDLAGWYEAGTTPGETGTAIVAGHVDNADGPSVFYRLGALEKGGAIEVARRDGSTALFTVDAVEVYDKNRFPDEKVYGAAHRPELRVITCGGGHTRGDGLRGQRRRLRPPHGESDRMNDRIPSPHSSSLLSRRDRKLRGHYPGGDVCFHQEARMRPTGRMCVAVTSAIALTGSVTAASVVSARADDPKEIFEQVAPATVQVLGVDRGGTGVVYDADKGLVLTNAHVVSGQSALQVRIEDREPVPVRLMGSDPCEDLAVLKLVTPQKDLDEVQSGSS